MNFLFNPFLLAATTGVVFGPALVVEGQQLALKPAGLHLGAGQRISETVKPSIPKKKNLIKTIGKGMSKGKGKTTKKKCSCKSKKRGKGKKSGKPCTCGSEALLIVGHSPEASIRHCDWDALLMEGSRVNSISPGMFVWSTPNTGDNMCNGCSPVFRKVVSVAPSDATGAFSCPGGNCMKVMTSKALVEDVFSPELVEAWNLTHHEQTELEPLFGCPFSNNQELNGADLVEVASHHHAKHDFMLQHLRGTVTDPISDTDRQRELVSTGPSVPDSCNEWARVNSDGRCKYSDCFVGKDGDPNDCFFCKTTCDNGCGPSGPLGDLIPESIPLVFDFSETCCVHDHCYASSFSKAECDNAFLRQNLASCVDQVSDILYFIPLPLPIIGSQLRCPAAASLYYSAVALGGAGAHANAQKARDQHEDSQTCTAKCPTEQRSGGQGTTTLRVDLLYPSGTFQVYYQFYTIKDQLEVFYEGKTLFSTGGLVSGSRTVDVTYSGTSTIVEARISAPNSGTAWDVRVGCPPQPVLGKL